MREENRKILSPLLSFLTRRTWSKFNRKIKRTREKNEEVVKVVKEKSVKCYNLSSRVRTKEKPCIG